MLANIQRLEATDRHAEAFRLRLAGHDYATIAEMLGYSGKQGPHEAVKAEIERRVGKPAEDYRQLLIARAETLWAKQFAQFEKSETVNLELVEKMLKTLDRMAKLAGLQSTKLQINLPPEGDDQEPVDSAPAPKAAPADQLAALLEKLRARAAERAKSLDVIDHSDALRGNCETNGVVPQHRPQSQ